MCLKRVKNQDARIKTKNAWNTEEYLCVWSGELEAGSKKLIDPNLNHLHICTFTHLHIYKNNIQTFKPYNIPTKIICISAHLRICTLFCIFIRL